MDEQREFCLSEVLCLIYKNLMNHPIQPFSFFQSLVQVEDQITLIKQPLLSLKSVVVQEKLVHLRPIPSEVRGPLPAQRQVLILR